jgi:hypothetical protein
LMAGSREWTIEAKDAQATDELAPLTGCPPAHGPVPCSNRYSR